MSYDAWKLATPPHYEDKTPDDICEDVQENHADHMEECPTCTWYRCGKYDCDCGVFGSGCGG